MPARHTRGLSSLAALHRRRPAATGLRIRGRQQVSEPQTNAQLALPRRSLTRTTLTSAGRAVPAPRPGNCPPVPGGALFVVRACCSGRRVRLPDGRRILGQVTGHEDFELGTDGPKMIVVGLDGSRTSWRAASYANGLARRQRSRVTSSTWRPGGSPPPPRPDQSLRPVRLCRASSGEEPRESVFRVRIPESA